MSDIEQKTIQDFGDQWERYTDNSGYYGAPTLLQDVFGSLLKLEELAGRRVMEIGSGSGRIVNMLLDAGVAQVVAVEPSSAMAILRQNTQDRAERIEYIQATGATIPPVDVNYIISIGVLHHIPDPEAVVANAFRLLKPGGKFLFWVYGYEGNGLYLTFVNPLRKLTQRLPDTILVGLSHFLNLILSAYIFACRFLPLPLKDYMRQVIGKFSWQKRSLVIFDQLNPAYAKYYRREEAEGLMRSGGFENVQLYHRHGYSWTVIGEKP